MAVKLKQDGKFEYLYLKDAIVYYAKVQEPDFKYESDEKEYSLTAFINDEDREALEDFIINKELKKVGVDKNKKRKVKYETDKYHLAEGLNGISLTLPEKNKKGKNNTLLVVDKEGNPIKDLIGNGSRCNIKCWGYRNKEEALVVGLNLVQVIDLVPYDGGAPAHDDELGIDLPKPKKKENPSSEFEDDDVPNFDDDDDNPF